MPYPVYLTIPIPAIALHGSYYRRKNEKEQIDDLGEVLIGNIPVHRKEDEIIIYSVGGMPIEDVAWGTVMYRNALEKGIGAN